MKSKFGTENIVKFSNLVNKETLWVGIPLLLVKWGKTSLHFVGMLQAVPLDYVISLHYVAFSFSLLTALHTLQVVSELVREPNVHKRSRMVKQFLKIAKQCREAQNYNSMFAITSGLNHTAVSRLKQVSQTKS